MKQNKKLRNRYALRHGSYAAGITALVIAAVILCNVLATSLARRFPLNLDLTANRDFSISAQNADYIRGVDRPVTITVCANEDSYASYMANYAYSLSYYGVTDESNGGYYTQAQRLLEEYTRYNDNITLVYADPYDPTFANVQARATSGSLTIGSILVESSFELEGQTVNRNKVLNFEDLYNLTTSNTTYETVLTGSNVETAVTSAIYSVTSDKTTQVAYLSAHTESGDLGAFADTLEDNNYSVTAIDNLVTSDIPDETEILFLVGPTSDFSAGELAKLDDFLDHDGQRGKALIFFASAAAPDLPNLYAFLEEWGISVGTGTIYETNESNYLQTPATIGLLNNATDYTESANDLNRAYIATNNLPLSAAYESDGNRVTASLMQTSETVVVRPADADDGWSPDGAVQGLHDAALLSVDTIYDENYAAQKSYLAAFSSADFISDTWAEYTGRVGNSEFVLALLSNITGRDANDISFTQKTIDSLDFADQVTAGSARLMAILFVFLIPIVTIVIGILTWRRRKNK